MTTTICMPAGLTFKCIDKNNGNTPVQPIYGAMYGTPTTSVSNFVILVTAGHPSGSPIQTAISFIFSSSSSPPVITNQPVNLTNIAGGNATFSVVAGGVPALAYHWNFNTNTALLNATNTSLTLTNLRASQAGTYSVTITNSAGSTNSTFATLVVTNPPPPPITGPAASSGTFQFTFTPVVGLTNTVLTNGSLTGGTWNVFTNILPPANATPIVITHSPGISSLFYRVLVVP